MPYILGAHPNVHEIPCPHIPRFVGIMRWHSFQDMKWILRSYACLDLCAKKRLNMVVS